MSELADKLYELTRAGKIEDLIRRAANEINSQEQRIAGLERRLNAIPVYTVEANPEEGNLSIDRIGFSPIGFVGGWCRTEDVTTALQRREGGE